jgi:hypothetical protein
MTEKIHPANSVQGEGVSVGILTATRWVAVKTPNIEIGSSDPQLLMKPLQYRELSERWTTEDFDSYLKNPQAPTWQEAFDLVHALVDYWTVLKDPREKLLVSTWTMATYFHQMFTTFPRLNFHGQMSTGKSKALRTISLLAFNGLWYLNPSPAVLFRLIDALRPTLCLDEVESLSGNDHKDINAILNAGYMQGMSVPRAERLEAGGFEPTSYAVYAPIAFGGIRGLNRTLADRTITITTVKSLDTDAVNRPMPKESAEFAKARAACDAVFLLRFQDVANSSLVLENWLTSRVRQLYEPLLTIAHLASEDVCKALYEMAWIDADKHSSISDEGAELLLVLRRLLKEGEARLVYPGEIGPKMEPDRYGKTPTPAEVGGLLRGFGFEDHKRRGKGVPFWVERERVDTLLASYGIEMEDKE